MTHKIVSCVGCGNVYNKKLSGRKCPVCDHTDWIVVTPSDTHE